MNDPIYMEFAKSFGAGMAERESESDVSIALAEGLRRALNREAKPSEVEFLSEKFSEYEVYYNKRPELSKSLIEGIKDVKTPENICPINWQHGYVWPILF